MSSDGESVRDRGHDDPLTNTRLAEMRAAKQQANAIGTLRLELAERDETIAAARQEHGMCPEIIAGMVEHIAELKTQLAEVRRDPIIHHVGKYGEHVICSVEDILGELSDLQAELPKRDRTITDLRAQIGRLKAIANDGSKHICFTHKHLYCAACAIAVALKET